MKKWIILGILVLCIAIGVQYRPRDLKELVLRSTKDEMTLRLYSTTVVSSESYINESKEYTLTIEDEEYQKILDICDKYTYHHSPFADGSQMVYYDQSIGEVVYYGVSINDISVSNNQPLFSSYFVGNIGYKKSDRLSFISEIEDLMSNVQKDYLYRKVTFENDEMIDDYREKYWVEE